MAENKFHLIGIGGIGMSALARLLLAQNHSVSGSDLSQNGETEKLKKEGAQVFSEHTSQNIQEKETTIVYSTAISDDNPEMVKAKSLQCPLWHRSDLLSYLMQSYQPLAVAGTHGKTSTSALLTHTLISCSESPTYVVGGILMNQKTNSQKGTGKYFVLEADESDGSLLKYHPYGSILTNMEEDHLDYYYRDLSHIRECFTQYIGQVKDPNVFFWCKDCPNLRELNPKGFSYGFHKESDLKIVSFRQDKWSTFFSIEFKGKRYEDIELSMIGQQNVLNAAAVFGLCLQLNIEGDGIREAFQSFKGIRRRGERIGTCQNIEFVDDYAHHPTEVEYLLKSIRKSFPQRRVLALFQPHRYSRMKYFQEDFSKAFKKSSEVWLTEVYAAGEPPLEDFDPKEYASRIEKESLVPASFVPKEQLVETLLKKLKPHDVVVTIGAGDITRYGREAFKALQEKPVKLKVGVICGSRSPEHYISLNSSKFFIDALDPNLYDTTVFKIDLDGNWQIKGEETSETLSQTVFEMLLACDLFIPIVHGPHGEDGMIQGFLQTLKKPYVGPNYITCGFTMNKVWTKAVIEKAGIKVARSTWFTHKEWISSPKKCIQKIEKEVPYPLAVKPVSLGSSIAISFAGDRKEFIQAAQKVFEVEENVLVEEKIKGREFEICILDDDPLTCPRPGEICSKSRQYDYSAKYSKDPIVKIPQADLDPKLIQKCQVMAKKVYRAIQGKGFIRIDFFINQKGDLIFSEVNPMPGCTPKSLFPRMLKAHGLMPKAIVDQMVINGLYNHRLNRKVNMKTQLFAEAIEHVSQ